MEADGMKGDKLSGARGRALYSGVELLLLAEQYILDCRRNCPGKTDGCESGRVAGEEETRGNKRGKRSKERFPNIAGFCRYLGVGHKRYQELAEQYPDETSQISAAFEDEALNSEKPAALIGAYLKTRLGYDDRKADRQGAGLSVVFEHDILADGE
jgi:hypothetical protein